MQKKHRKLKSSGVRVWWYIGAEEMILFSYLPFSAHSLCHAGLIYLGKRGHLCWLSVGKSSQTVWQPPSRLSQFRGDLWWGWQGCLQPGLGGCCWVWGRHSLVTACEHERYLIFSSAPLLSYSQLEKGRENAFGHCPYTVVSLTVWLFFQCVRSQSSAASKMPLESFLSKL